MDKEPIWKIENPHRIGENLSYSRLVRADAFDEGATAQLRKVAERIRDNTTPHPHATFWAEDDYLALLQEAGVYESGKESA